MFLTWELGCDCDGLIVYSLYAQGIFFFFFFLFLFLFLSYAIYQKIIICISLGYGANGI